MIEKGRKSCFKISCGLGDIITLTTLRVVSKSPFSTPATRDPRSGLFVISNENRSKLIKLIIQNMQINKDKFEYGYTIIRHDIRKRLKLSNEEYSVAHALSFAGKNDPFNKSDYAPTIESLAIDVGISRATLFRCLKILRAKKLVFPDRLASTELWKIEEQKKAATPFFYNMIDQGHRSILGLTMTEYIVAAIYSRLSENREWVTLDKKKIATVIDISERQLRRIIRLLEIKKLVKTQIRKIRRNCDFLDVKITENWPANHCIALFLEQC